MVIILIVIGAIAAGAYALSQNSKPENNEPENNKQPQPDANEMAVIEYAASFNQTLQQKVVDGFKAGGNVTAEQVKQVEFLKALPYAEQVNSIVNGSFANPDWDGDRMNNRFEQVVGMPWNTYNGRYAILVDTAVGGITTANDNMYNFLTIEQKFLPENVIKLSEANATIANFERAVSDVSKRADGNSVVYVSLKGHGLPDVFCFSGEGVNKIYYADIDRILDKITPKAMIINVYACDSNTAVAPLSNGPSPRVVSDTSPSWLFKTSKNYHIMAEGHIPEPAKFDIDKKKWLYFYMGIIRNCESRSNISWKRCSYRSR